MCACAPNSGYGFLPSAQDRGWNHSPLGRSRRLVESEDGSAWVTSGTAWTSA